MSLQRWKSIAAVVVDPFRRKQLAASRAAEIAARSGAKLTLLHTFMFPQLAPDAELGSPQKILAAAIRERRRRLEQIAAGLRRRGIVVRCVVEWDYPAHEAAVRYVMRAQPDLLVAESQRHGRLARWLLANTDWELIRTCPCPVWFVRSATLPRRPQVLVAVDPRHTHAKPARLDDRLLQAAQTLTAQVGGRVSMAHAYESPVTAVPGTFMEPIRVPVAASHARDFVAATTKQVARLAARHGIAPDDCDVVEGEPGHVLAQLAARRKVDVLLLGAVSRSRLAQPIIGSTAERVIDHIACDVFIVKPAGFRSPVSRVRPKVE